MSDSGQDLITETITLRDVAAELKMTRALAEASFGDDLLSEQVTRVKAPAGSVVSQPGDKCLWYWFLLKGEIRAEKLETDGSKSPIGVARTGDGFGEVPLLTGRTKMEFLLTAMVESELIRIDGKQFWKLMADSPEARQVILSEMSQRLQSHQVEALHREKLVSLGTLAAGLMHELHNPGSAAKRAASQLRENLIRLQQLSLRYSDKPKTPEQLECLRGLLEHSLKSCRFTAMSSVEQADAEEEMGEWLSSAGVENAFQISPVLVDMGFDRKELDCAREFFDTESFSNALNWLGALVSSVSLVCSIEESIARISDLAMAVKKFAYDEKSPGKNLDIHDSLQSTITILGHKLRLKQIKVEKKFEASNSTIFTRGSALSQVWTNLIDNAADASAEGGKIEVTTWSEPGNIAVSIADHGSGIPPEVLPRIFEPFFTTKPQGSGTGLGLEIAHRIVTQRFGGKIDVESTPGNTRFIVRLPLEVKTEPAAVGAAQTK